MIFSASPKYLWNLGLFREINQDLGTVIDDYYEEIVPWDSLPRLRELVVRFRKRYKMHGGAIKAIDALEFLISLGVDLQRPLFFVF
jgi:hypothetical protein